MTFRIQKYVRVNNGMCRAGWIEANDACTNGSPIIYDSATGTGILVGAVVVSEDACPKEVVVAQINTAAPTAYETTTESGCAAGVQYSRITRRLYDGAGLLVGATTIYVDAAGVSSTTTPPGFVLGDCGCIPVTTSGLQPQWGF